jgi:hypothetical protein
VQDWATDRNFQVRATQDEIHLSSGPVEAHLNLVTDDLFAFADRASEGTYDAVIAQAVLDLLHLSDFFNSLRPLLREQGLWYLPIHFDGVTGFEPPVDAQLDDTIEQLYHESMTETGEEGGRRAHTGRRLLTELRAQDDQILAAGSSDWIVFPREGGYLEEEAYFLHHILYFIEEELSSQSGLEEEAFANWIQTRRQQINTGSLVYIAHQLDVLARAK